MKTKKKDFDAVAFMRKVRDKISVDIANLSKEQMINYFRKNRPKKRIIPCA